MKETIAPLVMMTKADYLALAETRFEALCALERHADFYTFEKEFDQVWTGLGRQVLEQTVGPVPADKRKKTVSAAATARLK